ncbi:MAG: LamG domain-containing protein [Deltaproteobacteria bacterium]|nr:LamG domain-containing protein [Deltaproteobacteria bacterium]
MRARVLVLVAALGTWACGSPPTEGSQGTFRTGIPAQARGGLGPSVRATQRGSSCPPTAPIPCGSYCCGAGLSCGDQASCRMPPGKPSCAPGETACRPAECLADGCRAADSSANGNEARVSYPASFGEGRRGGGVDPGRDTRPGCTGVVDLGGVVAPGKGFPVGKGALTFEAWVRRDGAGWLDAEPLLWYGGPDAVPGTWREIGLGPSGLWVTTGAGPGVTVPVSVGDGAWHRVAVVLAGGPPASVRVFVDGAVAGGGDLEAFETTTVVQVRIGSAPPPVPGGCTPQFHGSIDEVRVSAASRTDGELTLPADAPLQADEFTAALWHFDDREDACCMNGCAPAGGCAPPVFPALPACPAALPVACGDGCCPPGPGVECLPDAPGGPFCVSAGVAPLPGGPDPGTDCPVGHPDRCGEECCLVAAPCTAGRCGCPDGQAECGDWCCGDGVPCEDGQCKAGASCPDPDFPAECGDSCCATGYPCVLGHCTCNTAYPLECAGYCCLPGATCSQYAVQPCSCPPGRPACGMADLWCCEADEECRENRCVKVAAGNGSDAATGDDGGGGGSCPGGWMGSTARYGAVGMSDDCAQAGDLSICITKAEFEGATGLTFPSSCTQEGSTGCVNDSGTLVAPCCPGLVCVFRSRCGADAVGGKCMKR